MDLNFLHQDGYIGFSTSFKQNLFVTKNGRERMLQTVMHIFESVKTQTWNIF
jgi:hypothetical protein